MTADDIPHPAIGKESEGEDPFRRVRLEKLATLRGLGVDPYPVGFARTDGAAAPPGIVCSAGVSTSR